MTLSLKWSDKVEPVRSAFDSKAMDDIMHTGAPNHYKYTGDIELETIDRQKILRNYEIRIYIGKGGESKS